MGSRYVVERPWSRRVRGLPGLSLSLAAAALVLQLWPGAVDHLAYVPGALARGEWWRLLTCHLVHWSWDHVVWDAGTFLLIGAWCERAGRRPLLLALLLSGLAIPPVVLAVQPQLSAYAGLSGWDVALYALLVARLLRERWPTGDAAVRLVLVLFAGALVAKVGYELATGGLWFVRSHEGVFVPVPMAHVVGACVGLLVGWAGAARGVDRGAAAAARARLGTVGPSGLGARAPQ